MGWRQSVESALVGVLSLCAVVVTVLLVRREFFAPPSSASPQPRHVKEWRQYAVGPEIIGSASAHDTLVVFSEFQCPFCAELAATLQRLEDSSASSLLIVHRNLPITAIHPFARPAAIAGLCAAKQGVFPAFYEMVFRHQDSLGVSSWSSVAVQAGVRDTVAFAGCLTDPTVLSILEADSLAAAELRIAGTPAMLVHGLLVAGAIPGDSILRLLGAEKGG